MARKKKTEDTRVGGIVVTLEELGMAYRKAKVDLFYSPRMCRSELLEFESHLLDNLKTIRSDLSKGAIPDLGNASWTLIPKGIKPPKNATQSSIVYSSPLEHWKSICEGSEEQIAEFRVMEELPIAFHVFATLWIQKVGHLFEGKLRKCACGNRLRRTKEEQVNPLSLGSMNPYLHPYCQWRDDGIDAMRTGLEQKKKVIAITADVSSFFHKLDPRFMKDTSFQKEIGVTLDPEQKQLNDVFIDILHEWATRTPLKTGLPVGLTASAVIANVALFELDQIIATQVVPLYYGRYVDDIILVMENTSDFTTTREVWEWLFARCGGALHWKKGKEGAEVQYLRDYLANSEILFSNEKNRMFMLAGATGKALTETIARQIQMRTSEWRSLPDLAASESGVETRLLSAIQRDGTDADSLRKADKLSVRRAGFAIQLRDMEAYARALPPGSWQKQRHAFLRAFISHILVLPDFFDFFTYIDRVLQVATSCGDVELLTEMMKALEGLLVELKKCKHEIKADDTTSRGLHAIRCLPKFERQLRNRVVQSILVAFPLRIPPPQRQIWEDFLTSNSSFFEASSADEIQKVARRLFERDLGHRPFRNVVMPQEMVKVTPLPVSKKNVRRVSAVIAQRLLLRAIVQGNESLAKLLKMQSKSGFASGFLFPTRPLTINELYVLCPKPFSETGRECVSSIALALRGFRPEDSLPAETKRGIVEIPFAGSFDKIRIAVASWKTEPDSWVAAVTRNPDPDHSRYGRICDLVNAVLRCRSKPHYLILPELSIPPGWFLPIAHKLQGKGISLISGVEYQHARGKKVRSQVWAGLSFDAFGFPSMLLYKQDKQRPAIHEEQDLYKIGGVTLQPAVSWTSPPVVSHADFKFAIMLCSELTNIAYRSDLRGRIDTLFIPEWNRDTDSFNPLVESAALDMHAYIVQCNDRHYGDSRIRAPMKESWERDIIRVKGGLDDYFVVGEIDVKSLRRFQSRYRSADKPYKPVPDGFRISPERETLPQGRE